MYKILSCNPTGMFSYGWHKTIPIDGQGSVLLEGKNLDRNGNSNGSGKTSFFYAICHILYGKNPSGEGADKVVNKFLEKYFGQVTFLDKNNTKWRVSDVRKWRKTDKYPDQKISNIDDEPSEIHNAGQRLSGTDVYLERWDDVSKLWIDERSSNRTTGDVRLDLKATRKKIVDILEIDYDQFMSVAYLAQQQTLRFISGTHKERLQVLAELSDLKAWDKRIASIREDISEQESEKSRLESKLDGLGQVAFTKPTDQDRVLLQSSIDSLALQLDKCDLELKAISQQQTAWELKRNILSTEISNVVSAIKENSIALLSAQLKLDTITKNYISECDNIRNSPRPFEVSRIETETSELNGQITARRFDLEQLLTGAGKCPRCRTNVSIDHIVRHRELINLEIQSLNEKIIVNKNNLEKLTRDIQSDTINRLNAKFTEHESNCKPILDKISDLNVKSVEFNKYLDIKKSEEASLGGNPNEASHIIERKRLTILSQKSLKELELKQFDESLKRYNDHQLLITSTTNSIHKIDYEIRHLKILERLFGDRGIKAFKLDNILTILNHSLDKYINIITDGSVKVSVSQYREKSDGDLATDLQIIVREGHKHEVPFALYSGGERQQITLAFIGAFWQLASRCGSGVNIMCLDEIFGPLDEYNIGNVFNYLDHMRLNGKNSIFIVTHNEHIKHQVKFDQIWTITKKDHMSTLDQGK